ncbi:hypothetical protein ACFW7P_17150 [Streptomyces albidoflavus]
MAAAHAWGLRACPRRAAHPPPGCRAFVFVKASTGIGAGVVVDGAPAGPGGRGLVVAADAETHALLMAMIKEPVTR